MFVISCLKKVTFLKAEANPQLMEQIEDEIHEDYLLSVKKAIVDFVLRDPNEKYEYSKDPTDDADSQAHVGEDDLVNSIRLQHRRELAMVPKPWHPSYLSSTRFCQKHLHATNRCMTQVLDLWFSQFKLVFLKNIDKLRYSKLAVKMLYSQLSQAFIYFMRLATNES